MTDNTPSYYTIKDLAERYNVSISTIRNWVRGGNFPNAYKAGKGIRRSEIRIPVEDVANFDDQLKLFRS